MSIFLFLFQVLSICLFASQGLAEHPHDICGNYATLSQIDSFFIAQSLNQTFDISLKNYENFYEQFRKDSPKFAKNLESYDTKEEILASEPDNLIPFTPTHNLIKITGSLVNFNSLCKNKSAFLIPLTPSLMEPLIEILKANSMQSTPVAITILGQDLISLDGQYLSTPTSAEYDDIVSKMKTHTPVLKVDGALAYKENGQGTGFCYKPSNPWDLDNSLRRKWLTTVPKVKLALKELDESEKPIKDFMKIAKQGRVVSSSVTSTPYEISQPSALVSITNTIKKYKLDSVWEKMLPGSLDDFLKIVSLAKDFKRNFFGKQQSKTFPNELTIPAEDGRRLLSYLNVPPNFSISSSIKLKPVKGTSIGEDFITVQIQATIFDTNKEAQFFQVKPLISKSKISTIQHLIAWDGKALAFTQEPALINCVMAFSENNDQVKVCNSFHQPGLTLKTVNERTLCAKALLAKTDIEGIRNCPTQTVPADLVAAVRVKCEGFAGEVAVVSASSPAKISVHCSNTNKKAYYYRTFPVHLVTPCEIRLVTGETEHILLPEISSSYHEDGDVSNINIVTPSTTLTEAELQEQELERNSTLKESKIDNTPFSLNDLFRADKYLPHVALTLSGFGTLAVSVICTVFCIGRDKTIELLSKGCCGCIRIYNWFLNCTKPCQRSDSPRVLRRSASADIQMQEINKLLSTTIDTLKRKTEEKDQEPSAPASRQSSAHPSRNSSPARSIHSTSSFRTNNLENRNKQHSFYQP